VSEWRALGTSSATGLGCFTVKPRSLQGLSGRMWFDSAFDVF
jgi:hypothetical protein